MGSDLASAYGQKAGASLRPWTKARFISINTTTNRAIVSIDGSEPVALPYNPAGSYTGVAWVFVVLDPMNSGVGPMVVGPCSSDASAPTPQSAPSSGTPQTEQATALIKPLYTGSYRSSVSRWEDWNVARDGRSAVWQGNQYGSGPMTGFAGYGTQVADLGALSIQRIVVSTPLIKYSGSITLQGSASGTKPGGAPSGAGPTASGVTAVDLPDAVCESFRTGAYRGLVTAGSNYRVTRGSAYPNGMTLSVTYTRPA